MLAALAAVLAGAALWVFTPSAVQDAGSSVGLPLAVGETVYAGLLVHSDDPINVRSVTPRVSRNDAGATVTVMTCTVTGADGVGAVPAGEIARLCAPLEEFVPAVLALPTRHSLVVAITPTRPGMLRIDGVDISYRDGLRIGRQHTGVTITGKAG